MADGVPFGNYRLLKRLARGGMAEVFLARHVGVEGFERRVAIKRILPHLSESEEFRVMFLDEARLAAQLAHPNIVHIYDFGKADDYYYIAMEYVDGVDIGRLIRKSKERPVPCELAARIFADVCSGLHYAHNASDPQTGKRLNLVHRDVTPQNVLVTYDGVVKIVDFGIAKAAWSAGQTRPGVVKGKFAYMSPEQVEGRALDGRSDVFSAGICLYEMLTGVPLFRRDDVNAAMREIRDGKPIALDELRPEASESLVSIVRRALARSKDARYASAGAMQHELEKYLKDQSALATAAMVGEYLRREHPRPPDEDGGGTGTAAQPAGTQAQPAGTQAQSLKTPPQRTPAQAQSQVTPAQSQSRASAALAARRDPTPPPGSITEPIADDSTDVVIDEAADELAVTTPDQRRAIDARATNGRADDTIRQLDADAPTRPPLDDDAPTRPPLDVDARTRPVSSPRRHAIDRPPSHTAVVPPLSSSRRRAFVAAGVAGAVALIALLLALRPWSSSQAGPITIDPETPGPAPTVTPLPTGTPVSTAGQPRQPSDTTAPTDRAPTAAAADATLDIVSRPPGARVTVDGRELATATPLRGQSLPPGPHRVLVERHGFVPRELAVPLAAGEHRTLDVELHPGARHGRDKPRAPTGYLTVRTVPWSKVFDGPRLLGTTPMANVPLAEGAHALTFVNPDLPPLHKTVVVRAGEEARVSLELHK
jgi:eukaryotic-like serine/threonine-protein kinase